MDSGLITWARAVKVRGGVGRVRHGRPKDGLRPAIYVFSQQGVDGRDKHGHDGDRRAGHDRFGREGQVRRLAPPLWLFTDSRRMADPLAAAARLPHGLAGIVFRNDTSPDRGALAHRLARLCRTRRLALVVAGDTQLAARINAGVHLRGGRWPGPRRIRNRPVTSSAHSVAELRRAAAAGAEIVFLSPVFATASHPDVPALGPLRWARLLRQARLPGHMRVLALGGITGTTVRRLPRWCAGVGAIGALA